MRAPGVGDYWIVDLIDRRVEVHRDPQPHGGAPYGWGYGRVEPFGAGARVVPLAAIPVDDLLP